jgi:hypothetical protein
MRLIGIHLIICPSFSTSEKRKTKMAAKVTQPQQISKYSNLPIVTYTIVLYLFYYGREDTCICGIGVH